MPKKVLKKLDKAPKFYIIRWEYDGKEVHRVLVDDANYVFWSAGDSREKSLQEVVRQRKWFKMYPDTWHKTLEVHYEAQKKNVGNQKIILEKLLKEPHVVVLPSVVFYLEPIDDNAYEKMLPKQRAYADEVLTEQQREVEEQQQKQQKEVRKKKLKGLLKRRFR